MPIEFTAMGQGKQGALKPLTYDHKVLPLDLVLKIAHGSFRPNMIPEVTITEFDPVRFELVIELIDWWQTGRESGRQWMTDFYVYEYVATCRSEFIALRTGLTPLLLPYNPRCAIHLVPAIMSSWPLPKAKKAWKH